MLHATSRLRYGKKFAFSQPLRDGMLSVPTTVMTYRESRSAAFSAMSDMASPMIPLPRKGAGVKAPSSSAVPGSRSEEHTSELQSRVDLVCRLLLEKKKT